MNGSFFLGTGHVGEETYYYYYSQEGNTFTMGRRPTREAVIVEDTQSPFMREQYFVLSNPAAQIWFAIPLPFSETVEFHVPQGSVLNNFSLDLE